MEKTNEIKKLDYVIIFFLLYLSSGFTKGTFSGTFALIMLGILAIFAIILHGAKFTIKANLFTIFAVLSALRILSGVITQDSLKVIVITLCQLLITILLINVYPLKNLTKLYSSVIYFLCVVSIVVFFVYLLAPNVIELFHTVTNANGVQAYDLLIATIYKNGNIIRNQSIFWEPGAFQTYIMLALIFTIWVEKNISIKKIVVFSIATILTFSTTGYIVFVAIISVYAIDRGNNIGKKVRNKRILIVAIFALAVVAAYIVLQSNTQLYYQVFGKLENYDSAIGRSSTSVRIDAVVKGLQAFWNSPIWGYGDEGYRAYALSEGYEHITCTWINWFALYGVFYGIIMNIGLFRFFKICDTKKIFQLLIWICFMLAIISEEYASNISILVFVLGTYAERVKDRGVLYENSGNQLRGVREYRQNSYSNFKDKQVESTK